MSLSIIRTPDIRLSFVNINVSPYGMAFILPLSNAKPELKGHLYWPASFKDDYTYYLKCSSN